MDTFTSSSVPDQRPREGSGWDGFPLICCINLEERDDRFAEAQEAFRQAGLRRVDFFRTRRRANDTDGAIIDSHMACLERAVEQNAPYVVVFEDDVAFDPEITAHLGRVIRFLEKNPSWELFHLGAFVIRQSEQVEPHIIRGGMITAHAYIMKTELARKILEQRPYCTGMSVDLFYTTVVGDNAYCHTYPLLCVQRPSASDGTWDKSGKNMEGWLGKAMVFTSLTFRDKLRYSAFPLFERLKIRNGMTFFLVLRVILRRKLRKTIASGRKVAETKAEGQFVIWEA